MVQPGVHGQTLDPWETVRLAQPDDYSSGGDIGTDPTGTFLFSAGSAEFAITPDADVRRVAVVQGSFDGGATWGWLDSYDAELDPVNGPGWRHAHYRGVGAAPNDVFFAAGELWNPDTGLKKWIVRRANLDPHEPGWTTVDLFTAYGASCGDIKVAPSGEIFAAGMINNTGARWLVRRSSDGGEDLDHRG